MVTTATNTGESRGGGAGLVAAAARGSLGRREGKRRSQRDLCFLSPRSQAPFILFHQQEKDDPPAPSPPILPSAVLVDV